MMATISSYARQWQNYLRAWLRDPRVRLAFRWTGQVLTGFLLSAASLANTPQPLVLGVLCAVSGWTAVRVGVGGMAGYALFWGSAGGQGIAWAFCGMAAALLVGERPISREAPLLLPAAAALTAAACGLGFQLWLGDDTDIGIYLLRVALATGSAWVFRQAHARQDALAKWLACGLCVLALAQVAPFGWLSLGHTALGLAAVAGAFPAAAFAGLAVDLAQVTPVPMTAVACLIYLGRLVPLQRKWMVNLLPGAMYLLTMTLCGKFDLTPLPGLMAGGLLALLTPGQAPVSHRRGSTGTAQVRLEMVGEAFSQTQRLLLEAGPPPVDEEALLQRCADRACGSCPARKTCRERSAAGQLSTQLLHRPLLDADDLPIPCRKPGRLLAELHRGQEQLRSIRADRERQKEYRAALIQQYQFLSRYLQDLSDDLGRRIPNLHARFRAEVTVTANRPQEENGDRCLAFAGPHCRYYVLLCDGMGTGMGAVEEGNEAARLLKRLLSAGYPAEHALRSLNSLCALRGRAGAATIDLAQLHLDSGRVCIYKWGAAASWLVTRHGTEKIGTATPPPGLSVSEGREAVEQLSLRRGEVLMMVSDGVGGEDALRGCVFTPDQTPGEMARNVLECGGSDGCDDATVVSVRLLSA